MSSRYTLMINEEEEYNPTINEDDDSDDSEGDCNKYIGKPGLCVIINNTDFANSNPIPGGNKDTKRLQVIFTMLDFEVSVHNNLTAAQILDTVESYSKETHKGVFVLALLSHGKENVISGSDDKSVKIIQLEEFFYAQNCPTLTGIPKIFLIDACRGKGTLSYHTTLTVKGEKAPDEISRHTSHRQVGNTSDFAFVYGSTYGYKAFIDDKEGSTFTQAFCKEMQKARPSKSFHQILLKVNRTLEKEKAGQTVEFVHRMKMEYYIKRDTTMQETCIQFKEKYTQLQEAVKIWAPIRERTIRDIEYKIADLIRHRRNTNIAKVTGSTTSIGGSILAIVGLALTPVTFGVSIGLVAGGVLIATAGGVTAAGASIADVVTQRFQKEVQAILQEDFETLKQIKELAKELLEIIQKTEERCDGADKKAILEFFTLVITPALVKGGTVDTKIAETMLIGALEIGAAALHDVGTAARVVAIAGVVLNVAHIIPIDMIAIGIALKNVIGDKNASRAVVNLRKTISELQEEKKEILKKVYLYEAQI